MLESKYGVFAVNQLVLDMDSEHSSFTHQKKVGWKEGQGAGKEEQVNFFVSKAECRIREVPTLSTQSKKEIEEDWGMRAQTLDSRSQYLLLIEY